jgi:hypothetical protein
MEMVYALPGLLPDVGDHPVALQSQFSGEGGDDGEDVAHHGPIVLIDSGYRRNMGLGDHQKMGGRLGGDVIESVAELILIDFAAGDFPGRDFAE